jgi:hypothetical protein
VAELTLGGARLRAGGAEALGFVARQDAPLAGQGMQPDRRVRDRRVLGQGADCDHLGCGVEPFEPISGGADDKPGGAGDQAVPVADEPVAMTPQRPPGVVGEAKGQPRRQAGVDDGRERRERRRPPPTAGEEPAEPRAQEERTPSAATTPASVRAVGVSKRAAEKEETRTKSAAGESPAPGRG